MSNMADLTENYQLKWHSFSTHLHSCVAAALNKETFTDVCLYTMDGHRILAHRFVLSACSQYLHDILKVQHKMTTTLPLLIVLPPEINYKTITTLIQYMYSGETTVSKDILENVLRGGDLLKVKGLWRPKEEKYHERKLVRIHEQETSRTVSHAQPQKIMDNSKQANTKISVSETSPRPQKEINQTDVNPAIQNTINVDQTSDEDKSETTDNKNSKAPEERSEKDKASPEEMTPDKRKQLEEATTTTTMDNLQFLVIKEEPIEWAELEDGEMEMLEEADIMFNSEIAIKPEVVLSDQEDKSDEVLYSPLTCELCSETFTLPGEWVRHIQTHTDMLPAKRQKRGKPVEDDNGTFPPLHCDMCQKYFPTPAEWVRHIQTAHTEFELRVSNKTTPVRSVRVRQMDSSHKVCVVCNKKFPSHASMIIHRRTHTGEKPYMCEHCHKGFNVKSNLLRHLRTLHDRIINSTDVEYRESINENSS